MPELPEVETVVRDLSKHLHGLKIVSGKVLCSQICKNPKPLDLDMLRGSRIKGVWRRGKMILVGLERNITILFHLGMTGQLFFSSPHDPIDRHTHFILNFAGSPNELRFRDIRKLGCLIFIRTDEVSSNQRLKRLGPEPLEIKLTDFVSLFNGRKARLKSLLLDQHFIAGIGNIYADEILFRAKLNPLLPARLLKKSDLRRLWVKMREVLEQAIKYKGSTIRDYVNAASRPGEFQTFHRVYGKEGHPCSICKKKIERMKISGRSTYFCPHCQALKRKG
jgi:formamidopyrimidine-DNA glycosylase